MAAPRYVLIANPGTKRCETYRRELLLFWAGRGVTPEVDVVPWADVVPRDGNLDGLPAFDRPAVVRLESPGKDDRVTRLMLEAGARDDPTEPPRDWRAEEIPKGLLLRPGLYYRGFRRVLRGLERSFAARPHLAPTACPLAVAEMFDKTATAAKLRAAGVPVPDWLREPRDVFAELNAPESYRKWRTIYLKLNTGSSATGIIVLRPEGGPLHGTTTLAEIDGRFFNSRRLLHLTEDALERAAYFLLMEGAFAQEGIPLAQIDGQNFDVRVVCVRGRPSASIFRLSPGPMTNLHLGGRRGDFTTCRAAVPTRDWLDALDHCAEAAACFDCAIAGVDLVFERGLRRHFVLEVNAFGDFFPGWTDARGRSVHALEIEDTAARCGAISPPSAGSPGSNSSPSPRS
ncbi:MAG TPA: STM4014 family protein [Gemmataceae bacterium]|nr:STM4014 family protein [Gemmataceae bacterium]